MVQIHNQSQPSKVELQTLTTRLDEKTYQIIDKLLCSVSDEYVKLYLSGQIGKEYFHGARKMNEEIKYKFWQLHTKQWAKDS